MAPTSLEGQTLGKYRVLEPLGRGGMAQVYRAYHAQLERYVAIKVLRSDLVEEEEFLTRFRREARAVAALRHPNIVQVYDFDVQDDLYYMVMELLEGDTLRAYLNSYRTRGEAMPWGEMGRILLDILAGLAYAHKEGIVHRDIKPANVLLTRQGQAVLTDFGIAQIIGATRYTISGALMGTLNYMSPEQGLEGRGDERSDIYSLGIVFYEMLTGRTPFDADTPLAILMKHLNDPLPLPHQFAPGLPEPLEAVILKALAKSPDDRYRSAEEMMQAVTNAWAAAGIELPERVSLPRPAQTAGQGEGGVAVFSGEARGHITNRKFAAEDTDSDLGQRLKTPAVASRMMPRDVVGQAAQPDLVSEQAAITKMPPNVGWVILRSIILVVGVNVLAVLLAVMFRLLPVYERAWPAGIAVVAFGLGWIMESLNLVWMGIPIGIILGNAFIMGYYVLTGKWEQWAFLWPVEPFLAGAVVYGTIWLARRKDIVHTWSRRLGRWSMWAAVGFSILMVGLSSWINIFAYIKFILSP
jgi:serine/threonine protein kinase